jgi:hypothetical protein
MAAIGAKKETGNQGYLSRGGKIKGNSPIPFRQRTAGLFLKAELTEVKTLQKAGLCKSRCSRKITVQKNDFGRR